jgi:hypothetical protein
MRFAALARLFTPGSSYAARRCCFKVTSERRGTSLSRAAQPFDHGLNNLLLTGGEYAETRPLLFGYRVLEQLPRRARPSWLPCRHGSSGEGDPSIDETRDTGLEGLPHERRVQVRIEDQDSRVSGLSSR